MSTSPANSSISNTQARRIILNSQYLAQASSFGGANVDKAKRNISERNTLKLIEQLGYVQIDTLTVVARAHLHTLWNRQASFSPDNVDNLLKQRKIFEYWSHALSYLPVADYRFSLPMMHRIASGEIHWYPKEHKHSARVLARIRSEGPLASKDFKDKKRSDAMWARSDSKQALEQLFMEGRLMISHRIGFQKYYDLRERVLPSDIDTRLPTEQELVRHLIWRYLQAQGLAKPAHIAYLRKGMGSIISATMQEMHSSGELLSCMLQGQQYYCTEAGLNLADRTLGRNRLSILSPFDNLIIQRARTAEIFDFHYQIECYTPKSKRRFGYFCLPVLWNNKMVARIDVKANRKVKTLSIEHLIFEADFKHSANFYQVFATTLRRFMQFNHCERISLGRVSENRGVEVLQALKNSALTHLKDSFS